MGSRLGSALLPEFKLHDRTREKIIKRFFQLCALISIFTTFIIVCILIKEALPFFKMVSVREFLTSKVWMPFTEPYAYGVLPLLTGTIVIVFGACVFAMPIGLACGIFLSHYASARVRSIIKPLLELLAGIPTVVYGYLALTMVTPALRHIFPEIDVYNALSASIVIGIMVLPMVSTMCDDALSTVPKSLSAGAYAIGATKAEVLMGIIVPSATSGITASYILSISRALGETMAVALAAGTNPNISFNLLEGIQTMTAYIVQIALSDAPRGTLAYHSAFAVAAVLFLLTLFLNICAYKLLKRFRRAYLQ